MLLGHCSAGRCCFREGLPSLVRIPEAGYHPPFLEGTIMLSINDASLQALLSFSSVFVLSHQMMVFVNRYCQKSYPQFIKLKMYKLRSKNLTGLWVIWENKILSSPAGVLLTILVVQSLPAATLL